MTRCSSRASLVPVVLSLAFAFVFTDDSIATGEGAESETSVWIWVLGGVLFVAWLGLRRVAPIPRGGFF